MARFKTITPGEYLVQRWKNGLGSTSQLAIEPPDSQFPIDPFLWRISSARVNASGPFSRYPGYERTLVLVEGAELRLSEEISGARSELKVLSPFDQISFAGERELSADLVTGELIDYNVFWRRDLVEARCDVVSKGLEQSYRKASAESVSLFVTAVGEKVEIGMTSLAVSLQLGEWESVRVDLDETDVAKDFVLRLTPRGEGSRAIVTELRSRS